MTKTKTAVTLTDPVGITEIADRLGVKPNVVSNWTARHDDFPEPVFRLAMGGVWDFADVRAWFRARVGATAA